MNPRELTLAKFTGITCKQCGLQWKPLSQKRGPAPKFCSPACKQANYRGTDPEVYQYRKNETRNGSGVIGRSGRSASDSKTCNEYDALPKEWSEETKRVLAEARALHARLRAEGMEF